MRRRANAFLWVGAMLALQGLLPVSAAGGGDQQQRRGQLAEDRWVPSLTITSGATIQEQEGSADSFLFEDSSSTSLPLRGSLDGDDLAVSAFVGASVEVMTPAFPIPLRPRLFLSADILPTFGSDRDVALQGDPDCARGPEPRAPCARDEDGSRKQAFGEDSLNGLGTKTTSRVDTLVFGASLGVALPLEVMGRSLRIKPSFGWVSYEVEAEGLLVDAACDPVVRCTDVAPFIPGFPPNPGFLRETILTASDSKRFHGIGPGLDIEMDVGRFGQVGASLFLGARAYHIPGNRKISFRSSQSFNDVLGADTATARFEVEVDPWMYRTHLGIRFLWLGSQK